MFDIVRKPELWQAWDKKYDRELRLEGGFHLKTIQDLAVYSHLRTRRSQRIAEVGGGSSRVLSTLAKHNECFNLDKFDGSSGGPPSEIVIPGVKNIIAYLGEFNTELQSDSFDVVFSISVVEHVPNEQLGNFLDDGLRILKTGGLFIHAIDLYLEDKPSNAFVQRFESYRAWLSPDSGLTPVGAVNSAPVHFSCDMATNPDNTMYNWGRSSPTLIGFRQKAQSVSLLLAGRKL